MYKSIHEVPKAWRYLDGWVLSLDQINQIVSGAEKSKKPFPVALNEQREKFRKDHKPVDGQWGDK